MKKQNDDYRRELAIAVLTAYVGASNSTSPRYIKRWLHESLAAYDSHFREEPDHQFNETTLDSESPDVQCT